MPRRNYQFRSLYRSRRVVISA
uniref:Uncharacterized protein n=1 Tax=Glossina morsitans morsitans TaxID=37546 RepID=A0A1B0G498_GLOMM